MYKHFLIWLNFTIQALYKKKKRRNTKIKNCPKKKKTIPDTFTILFSLHKKSSAISRRNPSYVTSTGSVFLGARAEVVRWPHRCLRSVQEVDEKEEAVSFWTLYSHVMQPQEEVQQSQQLSRCSSVRFCLLQTSFFHRAQICSDDTKICPLYFTTSHIHQNDWRLCCEYMMVKMFRPVS